MRKTIDARRGNCRIKNKKGMWPGAPFYTDGRQITYEPKIQEGKQTG